MKISLMFVVLLMVAITCGCVATPVVVDNGIQSRVIVPCTNDSLCVRNTYEVAKDVWCTHNSCLQGYANFACCLDYPVSYRSKNWEYETDRFEYIYKSRNLVVR